MAFPKALVRVPHSGTWMWGPVGVYCGVSIETRVINGRRAKEGMFPWMARLNVHFDSQSEPSTCGGTIVTRRHILTAAHCVVSGGRLHPKIVATYGAAHSASQQALTTNIKSVAYHPQFSEKTFFNDIAILKTAEEIQLSAVVRPICINLDPADWTGKEVTVAGWGIQKPETNPSEKLRYTKLTVLSQEECKTKLKLYNFDENTMICAFQEDTDACKGDSGSGLTHSNGRQVTQIAIVSHGVGCAEGLPGVYTSVHKFKDWILSTIEGDKGFKDLSN